MTLIFSLVYFGFLFWLAAILVTGIRKIVHAAREDAAEKASRAVTDAAEKSVTDAAEKAARAVTDADEKAARADKKFVEELRNSYAKQLLRATKIEQYIRDNAQEIRKFSISCRSRRVELEKQIQNNTTDNLAGFRLKVSYNFVGDPYYTFHYRKMRLFDAFPTFPEYLQSVRKAA